MKVLIVDDNPDIREPLGRVVERLGFAPILASDLLRANAKTKEMPILATTALFRPTISKPFGSGLQRLHRQAV